MQVGPDPFEVGLGVAGRVMPRLQRGSAAAYFTAASESTVAVLRDLQQALRAERAQNAALRERLAEVQAQADDAARLAIRLGRQLRAQ